MLLHLRWVCEHTTQHHAIARLVDGTARFVTVASMQNLSYYDRQDIGRDFWHSKQRERKSRIVNVDGHQVLRENMYDINSVRLCA